MPKKYVPVLIAYLVLRGGLSYFKNACPEVVTNYAEVFIAVGYAPILIGLYMLQKDSSIKPGVRKVCRIIGVFIITVYVVVTLMNLLIPTV